MAALELARFNEFMFGTNCSNTQELEHINLSLLRPRRPISIRPREYAGQNERIDLEPLVLQRR